MLEDSSVDCFAEVFLRNHTLSMGVFDDVFQYVFSLRVQLRQG